MTESAPLPTVAEWIHQASRRLAVVSLDAALEARTLLCSVLRTTPASLLAHPERRLTDDECEALDEAVSARLSGDPLNRLVERTSFRHIELAVPPGVFAPRPETESLVERVLA